MKAKAKILMAEILVVALIAGLFLAAGFELGAKASISPSKAIEMSGILFNGKRASKPVMM